jgi:hypothetical protein
MPTALTLHTHDRTWRAEVEARTVNFEFYRSIGTQVSVYHKLHTTSMWGSLGEIDWDLTPASLIRIQSVYRGAGPEIATREREWHNTAEAELSEWSAGHPISLPAGSLPSQGTALEDVQRVDSIVTIVIGDEALTGVVSAAWTLREHSVSAA